MSPAEKIKKVFAKSDVAVHSKVDDRIVSDALTALDKSEKTTPISAGPNIWRMIMNKTMTKVAAAAAIIAIVVVGMHYLGVSPDGAGGNARVDRRVAAHDHAHACSLHVSATRPDGGDR